MVNHTSSCIRQCNVRKNILVGRIRLYHKIYRYRRWAPTSQAEGKGVRILAAAKRDFKQNIFKGKHVRNATKLFLEHSSEL